MRNKPNFAYKDYVDKEKIWIDDVPIKYRFCLKIPFKSELKDKTALVILKNPSEADKRKSDRTINNVLKFCEKHYSQVYIMNLFPNYSTDSRGVNDFINSDEFSKYMEKNTETLNKTIIEVDDIIIAWGRNSKIKKCKYDEAITSFLNIIGQKRRKLLAVRIKLSSVKREYPLHAQVWHVNQELETYEWKNFS